MTIRFLGPLLCGGLLMLATAASAVEGNPIGGVSVAIETSAGGIIIAEGKTNDNGDFIVKKLLKLGDYKLKIGPIPAIRGEKYAGVAYKVGGQQDVTQTSWGVMVSYEGGRDIYLTAPAPAKQWVGDLKIGGTGTQARTFSLSIRTIPAAKW